MYASLNESWSWRFGAEPPLAARSRDTLQDTLPVAHAAPGPLDHAPPAPVSRARRSTAEACRTGPHPPKPIEEAAVSEIPERLPRERDAHKAKRSRPDERALIARVEKCEARCARLTAVIAGLLVALCVVLTLCISTHLRQLRWETCAVQLALGTSRPTFLQPWREGRM